MKKSSHLHALTLALTLNVATTATLSYAADTESSPAKNAASADYVAGTQAIEKKQWTLAAESFKRATLQDPKNADAWNMLGYSSRWAGKYPEAFDAYAKALALDPKHRVPTAILASPTFAPTTSPKRAPSSPKSNRSAATRIATNTSCLTMRLPSTNRSNAVAPGYSIFIAPSKPSVIGFAHSPLLLMPLGCRATFRVVT